MRPVLRSLLLSVACAAVSMYCAEPQAQSPAQFPDKPIRFILGFAAGGPTDISVRALAAAGARQLGQPLVVSNLTGAGGTLAMAEIARSPADGYTISMTTTSECPCWRLYEFSFPVSYESECCIFYGFWITISSEVCACSCECHIPPEGSFLIDISESE